MIQQTEQLPDAPTVAQIERMEKNVMTRIQDDGPRRRSRRVRLWTGAAAAVAVVALAAIISPAVLSGLGGTGASSSSVDQDAAGGAAEPFPLVDGARTESADVALAAPDGREVISNGWVQVTVDDVDATTQRITALADTEGGYVESSNIGRTSTTPDGAVVQPTGGESWITIRVPADRLSAVVDEVSTFGEVTGSSLDRVDVTTQAVDLRARIAAQEASVARLTELMGQAATVADLIAAESALAERQAQLDSDRQQLQLLESQVSMSSLTVALTPETEVVAADPAGFGDGLVAGWNGLIAALNGVVVALGFLLPWLAVLAVAGAVAWGIRRLVVRRMRSGGDE